MPIYTTLEFEEEIRKLLEEIDIVRRELENERIRYAEQISSEVHIVKNKCTTEKESLLIRIKDL